MYWFVKVDRNLGRELGKAHAKRDTFLSIETGPKEQACKVLTGPLILFIMGNTMGHTIPVGKSNSTSDRVDHGANILI